MQKPHKFLRQVLGSLKISCSNINSGCQIILSLDQIDKHESDICPYTLIKCKYRGCDESFPRVEIEKHEEECNKKVIICSECGEELPFSVREQHSCVHLIADLARECQALATSNALKLNVMSEMKALSRQDDPRQVHEGIKCSECGVEPIVGTRNVCLECINYNLCWRCKPLGTHGHGNFLQLVENGNHEYVTCDACGFTPLHAIRWKCKICPNFDFCHTCKHTVVHENHEFQALTPYFVHVRPLKIEKTGYRSGEIFKRQWEIFNNGLEKISNLILLCLSGEPCTGVREINFNNIEIPAKQSKIIKVEQRILMQVPGSYASVWKLATSDRMSTFGDDLLIQLSVIN